MAPHGAIQMVPSTYDGTWHHSDGAISIWRHMAPFRYLHVASHDALQMALCGAIAIWRHLDGAMQRHRHMAPFKWRHVAASPYGAIQMAPYGAIYGGGIFSINEDRIELLEEKHPKFSLREGAAVLPSTQVWQKMTSYKGWGWPKMTAGVGKVHRGRHLGVDARASERIFEG